MFSPLLDSAGVPTWDALLEQFTMLQTLVYNQAVLRDQLLGVVGGGSVLLWDWHNTTWLPSLAIVRQANTIYVYISGTENLTQAFGDVNGIYATDYGSFGCKVHTFFRNAWLAQRALIVPRLPSDWRDCNFVFVGHSLGAAVCSLGAFEWKQENPTMTVDSFCCAMPKQLTRGYNGPLPDSNSFIASRLDLVPLVPSNGLISAVFGPVNSWLRTIPIDWVHYAKGYYLDTTPAPGLIPDADLDRNANPSTIIGTFTYHFLQEYLQAIVNGWSRNVVGGRNAPIVNMVATLGGLPVNQTEFNNIDSDQYVSIVEANEKLFMSEPTMPLTSSNLPTVNNIAGHVTGLVAADAISTRPTGGTGMPSKVTFFYTVAGKQGFTETFYDPNRAPAGLTETMLTGYLRSRMAVSGRQTQFEYCRVSDTVTPRNVIIWTPDNFKAANVTSGLFGTGASTGESDFGSTALVVRKMAGSLFSRFFFRGIPDVVVKLGGIYSPVSGFDTMFAAYAAQVTTLGWAWRGTTGSVNPPALITNIVQAPGTQATFTLGAALFNIGDVGLNKVIRISRQRNPANVNGTHTVMVASTTSCITLAPLPVVGFIAGTGKMYYPNQGFKAITDMKIEGVQSKRVGLPFGLYHGKSKKPVRV